MDKPDNSVHLDEIGAVASSGYCYKPNEIWVCAPKYGGPHTKEIFSIAETAGALLNKHVRVFTQDELIGTGWETRFPTTQGSTDRYKISGLLSCMKQFGVPSIIVTRGIYPLDLHTVIEQVNKKTGLPTYAGSVGLWEHHQGFPIASQTVSRIEHIRSQFTYDTPNNTIDTPRWGKIRRPVICLVHSRYTEKDTIPLLVKQLKHLPFKGTILLTDAVRKDSKYHDMIKALHESQDIHGFDIMPPYHFQSSHTKEQNPYPQMLAAADAHILIGSSTSCAADMIPTGRIIYCSNTAELNNRSATAYLKEYGMEKDTGDYAAHPTFRHLNQLELWHPDEQVMNLDINTAFVKRSLIEPYEKWLIREQTKSRKREGG